MTDEELIARLRAANAYKGPDFNTPIADPIKVSAADRIEQLVATNEALLRREEKLGVLLDAAGSVADAMKDRAEAAEARADAAEEAHIFADAAMTAERDELRLKLAAMHRRAQKAEGKNERSANLLETVMRSIKEAIPPLPVLPSPYPLSLHALYHRIRAANNYARKGSGRAYSEGWHYLYPKLKAAESALAAMTRERDAAIATVKQAVGECLAGMTYAEVSMTARQRIERAIDRAALTQKDRTDD